MVISPSKALLHHQHFERKSMLLEEVLFCLKNTRLISKIIYNYCQKIPVRFRFRHQKRNLKRLSFPITNEKCIKKLIHFLFLFLFLNKVCF